MPSAGALLESVAPDASFITFPVTDGDSSRWPANTRPPQPSAREVNWYRKMTVDEKYACRWRNLIGQGIAKLLDKPGKEKYCLQCFPDGYWLFDHNKGPISNIRHDLYLHGSRTVMRFRSPAEFIPHGYWLLTDPTLNNQNCGCKYCGGGGKKTQTEISESLGLPTNRGPTSVTGSTGLGRRGGIRSGRGPHATAASAGSWVPKESRNPREMDPEWKILGLQLNLVSNGTRVADLRSNRVFRLGELVWCQWDPQALPCTEKGKEIDRVQQLWPAIIIGYGLDISVDRAFPGGFNGTDPIFQKRKYVLRHLGSESLDPNPEDECTLEENEILPWSAHRRSQLAPSSMFACSQHDSIADSYELAVKTAEIFAKFWAVCERLPVKVPLYAPTENAVTEDSFKNSRTISPVTPTSSSKLAESSYSGSPTPFSPAYSVEATPPQRSPARLVPASANRFRVSNLDMNIPITVSSNSFANPSYSKNGRELRDRQLKVPTVNETRYQGLWYGAERIWAGDIVRLSPERQAFSESLRISVKKLDDKTWRHKITPSPGAEKRGVLMRIDRIFTRISENGMKECAVAGPLYEIAPADWTDPAGDLINITTSIRQQSSQKLTQSCDLTYPWNRDEQKPRRDNQPTRGHLNDISTLIPPVAPPGYFLRPLLPSGLEIPLPVSYIAGRYYPEILKSPLLEPVLLGNPEQVQCSRDVSSDLRGIKLQSLCALAPGRYNCAVCADVRLASRTGMLQEAVQAAKGAVEGESKVLQGQGVERYS